MTDPLNLCVNTQTPLVQFLPRVDATGAPVVRNGESNLWELEEGTDYRYSPGGVTRMVYPLVRRLRADGILGLVDWVALNPTGPRTVNLPGMTLHNVALDGERMASYGRVKEAIWGAVHGLDGPDHTEDLLWTEHYSEFAYYNRASAEEIQRLDATRDFDAFYIHDFQQLAVGHMLHTLKPKIFRWHIPFDDQTIPEEWKPWLATYLNSYDLVVVSARRYLTSLKAFGHTGKVQRMYPYVDPGDFTHPTALEANRVALAYGIPERTAVVLLVGRMDPMKGQDRAIRAFAEGARGFPDARLVIVGNGSFSGSKSGLGLSKSGRWRAELERLVDELDLRKRVLFTGHLPQLELDAMFERARFCLLPSVLEGFGLVVVESWLHQRPTIVTERAGIAELVVDGRNGLLIDPDDLPTFADRISRLLGADDALLESLGQQGLKTSAKCTLETAASAEAKLLADITGG